MTRRRFRRDLRSCREQRPNRARIRGPEPRPSRLVPPDRDGGRAPVAQWIEHRSPKAGVGSSSLPRRTRVLLQVRGCMDAAAAGRACPICRALVSVWSAACLRAWTVCQGRERTSTDASGTAWPMAADVPQQRDSYSPLCAGADGSPGRLPRRSAVHTGWPPLSRTKASCCSSWLVRATCTRAAPPELVANRRRANSLQGSDRWCRSHSGVPRVTDIGDRERKRFPSPSCCARSAGANAPCASLWAH